MQKKPIHHSYRSVAALMAVAATLPLTISSSRAGEGGYSGMSGLAEREIIRRQEAVAEADRLFVEGREAFAKADFQQAVDKFRSALSILPEAPTLSDRRASYTDHLSRASVALAQEYRKVGKYEEARTLLDGVLSPDVDPNNFAAKAELGYLDDPIRTNPALTYEHTKNVDEVRRSLYMAQGNFDLGKFDAAKSDYESVLRIDPYNKAARRGMEKIAATKTDYYRAAYDHTRAELLMQVDRAWELSVPADLPVFDPVNGGTQPSDGVAYITEKLRRIIIPRIDFEDTSVDEAIDFLTLRAKELDTLELDPTKKGINFVIRKPRTTDVGAGLGGLDAAEGAAPLLGGGDPGSLRIDSLRLNNVPLAVALKYICDATKLRYKVDEYAVNLVPQTEIGEDLFTRTFRVPPDFSATLSAGSEGGAEVESDPFADTAGGGGTNLLRPRPPIIELLKNAGVVFSDGSSATLGASGTLLITNTPSELDKIEQLIEASSVGQPKQVKITTKFVEITQENNDELGFDWVVSPFGSNSLWGVGGTIGSGGPRVGSDFINPVNGTIIPGLDVGPSEQVSNIVTSGLRSGDQAVNRNSIDAILNNPGRTAQAINVAPGILGLTGIFGDTEMQVMMRGLSQKKGIDLMTAPSITARSGQKATIEVIREFIYPTEYDPPELPQSNGGNSLSSGSSGGIATPANPTAFETKNTGVTLEIEPTIGENDFVIDLRFLPEIVEFEGFINYGSPIQSAGTTGGFFDIFGFFVPGEPFVATITENRIEMPVFSKRSVNTSLTIYDGYTVAVGGLMREDVQNVEDKVPILGDIPLIGRLFQSKAENHIKSNLIIFVTAQIIDATGRPLRGADSGGAVPVSTGGGVDDIGVLPPIEGLPE